MSYENKQLFESIYDGNLDTAKVWIDKGADVNALDDDKETPLINVAASNFEIAKLLIENGADINAKNWEGFTALMRAAKYGQIDILKLLLEKGADVNYSIVDRGISALSLAEVKDRTEIINILKEYGAKE